MLCKMYDRAARIRRNNAENAVTAISQYFSQSFQWVGPWVAWHPVLRALLSGHEELPSDLQFAAGDSTVRHGD